jgi:thioester reductase-like protein
MKVRQYFTAKRILVTGATGFLGKVLLEKILYSLPEVGLVYVLIRGKQGSNLLERFKKEIVSSPCFDRLRAQQGNQFEAFIEAKVRPMYSTPYPDKATSRRTASDSQRRTVVS